MLPNTDAVVLVLPCMECQPGRATVQFPQLKDVDRQSNIAK